MCFIHSGGAGGVNLVQRAAIGEAAAAAFSGVAVGNWGQSSGFATFTGADTGRQARIPVAPFMGIYGVAPMRKGMYRTLPPNVSGGMGGNADIRQFTKGARIQFPVYAEGDQQLSLHEAYALCSVAGDLKISEAVDVPNWVVSMTLPRGIFT
jgi:acetamidase/formamidase